MNANHASMFIPLALARGYVAEWRSLDEKNATRFVSSLREMVADGETEWIERVAAKTALATIQSTFGVECAA